MTEKEIKKHFSKLGMRLFVWEWLSLIIQVLVLLMAGSLFSAVLENESVSLLVVQLSTCFIAAPLMGWMLKKIPASEIPEHRMTGKELFMAFCVSYVLAVAGNAAGLTVTYGIGILKGTPVSNVIVDLAVSIHPVVALVTMVILAPMAEEYMFRRLIVDRLIVFGEGTAIVFSGLLFGLTHGNLNQFAYAFLVGMFFAFIYIRTGKLWYPILLHMGINLMGTAASGESYLVVLLMVPILVCGIICAVRNRDKFRMNPGEIVIPKGRRFSCTIWNVGMLLYILFLSLMMAAQIFVP